MAESTGTHAFARFEWMLSLRYLRARRKEGFISVIAGFSFLGIMLGVAESLGAGFLPGGASYKDGIGYAILIVVLLYSPQGLFGRGA